MNNMPKRLNAKDAAVYSTSARYTAFLNAISAPAFSVIIKSMPDLL